MKRHKSGGPSRAPVSPGERLRPGERVMRHLLGEVERARRNGDRRLPTVRELAARLNVSVFTVHSAFQRLAGQGCIRSKVGNGTFLVTAPARAASSAKNRLKIALNTPLNERAAGDPWGFQIAQGILGAASAGPLRMMVLPVVRAPLDGEAVAQELLAERDAVDGLIMLPWERGAQVRAAYESAGKPVVEINPPEVGATANFVSTDFYGASRRLGQAWRTTGRKRVGMLATLPMTVSARLRYFGLMAGLELELHRDVSLQFLPADSVMEADGFQAIRAALRNSRTLPDAVYCFGDLLALGAIRALREHGLKIPDGVSVVGGTGMDLSISACPHLTRTGQPLEAIGKAAVAMLSHRIRQNGISIPGQILPADFIGGATTRPQENELLGIGK